MGRPVEPRSVTRSGDAGGWLIVGAVCVLPLAVLTCLWLGAAIVAIAAGTGIPHGVWGPGTILSAVFDGAAPPTWPPPPTSAVLVIAAILGAGLIVAPGLWIWAKVSSAPRRDDAARSMARSTDLTALLLPAVRKRAIALRPSLQTMKPSQIAAGECGITLGRLDRRNGPTLMSSWEDVILAIMAPRAGKTTGLAINAILDAPAGGAVVATSNKSDLVSDTAALREASTGERVWIFDPQRIAHTTQDWWWNPLAAVRTVEEARRLAGHFVFEDERQRGEPWAPAAKSLLVALLLAAAYDNRPITDVHIWLSEKTSRKPVELLERAGFNVLASALRALQEDAEETKASVYFTARVGVQCLEDPAITAWVTPGAATLQLHPRQLIEKGQTLYLLSKDGGGSAAALVSALTDRVMRSATTLAEGLGGRLDIPMIVVLDEAANVAPLFDLPLQYSHLGSRGIIPITILQSRPQGKGVWGETGFDALFSASTVKLIGAGIDDESFAESISRLIGDHDVEVGTVSHHSGRRSVSTSVRQQRIMPASAVRGIRKGHALVWATGVPKLALVKLLPSFEGVHAQDIHREATKAKARIATAARRGDGEHDVVDVRDQPSGTADTVIEVSDEATR